MAHIPSSRVRSAQRTACRSAAGAAPAGRSIVTRVARSAGAARASRRSAIERRLTWPPSAAAAGSTESAAHQVHSQDAGASRSSDAGAPADDRMSPILNSRMLSSRASFEARSTIAARDRGSVGRRAGDPPTAGGRRVHQRPGVVARDLETPTGDRRRRPRQPISVRANHRMPHRTLR
jgi:hypothetical protein